ncbi:sensor histidine kinase [Fulvivirga ligni]|uniref:sensor histidine kinase n=1 Tax=Fulvivirga ligni TaxID=2904246 RepID=UPI001F489D37|nr:sensor histidine kinase [Fulvivirga ligni]UII22443.1 sensor histidine kinase [Fulvivirga ligni]
MRPLLMFIMACLSIHCFSQNTVVIDEPNIITDLTPYITYWEDSTETADIQKVIRSAHFSAYQDSAQLGNTQWLHFNIKNKLAETVSGNINFTFTDYVDFYVLNEYDSLLSQARSGDLLNVKDRPVQSGVMVFHHIEIPAGKTRQIYVRLHSTTDISHQFKSFTLKSSRLYVGDTFFKRFEKEKLSQALFYGALGIMLIYNFLLFISLRSNSYLYYVIFLFFLLLFFASNNGYLANSLFKNSPRLDLYIRFLSPVSAVFFYLTFSRSFLKIRQHNRAMSIITFFIMLFLVLVSIIMVLGFWKTGRTLTIISAAVSFLAILTLAIQNIRQGFTPARYFLGANALFILGGLAFALERLNISVENDITEHAIQIATVFEVALFSLGLADRINVTRKELALQTLANERLETRRAQEKRKIIQQKNEQLRKSYQELDSFIYKTAHDIKGPLARLLGLCNVALMDVEDEKSKEYFSRFFKDAKNLDTILARLSSVYDISVTKVEPQEIDFSDIFHSIIEEYEDQLSGFSLEHNVMDGLTIYSDPLLIKFIVSDLLDNAIKFNDPTKDELLIAVFAAFDRPYLEISIMDNGIGIKQEDIPTLFEMFTRAAGIHGSIGLGLYMVNLAVTRLGGTIKLVESEHNIAHFIVRIPIQYKPLESEAEAFRPSLD